MAGLPRLGSRTALSFAFAFLHRSWRFGEGASLCTDLLQDCLEMLRALPEATLFDEPKISTVWLVTVEQTTKFLQAVVTGCAFLCM